ncbi:MAG: hypothetical protein IAE98_11625 [Candidatus Kapabacteria bacterium]|nr:hypothetical protein [Candidatus Kapabacteria bacterium]
METKVELNSNEILVLEACKQAIVDCTTNEFGYTSDVRVAGMTKNQIKGYLGQLSQKKLIMIDDEMDGQLNLRDNAKQFLNDIEDFETY